MVTFSTNQTQPNSTRPTGLFTGGPFPRLRAGHAEIPARAKTQPEIHSMQNLVCDETRALDLRKKNQSRAFPRCASRR